MFKSIKDHLFIYFIYLFLFVILCWSFYSILTDWYNFDHLSESDYCQTLSYRFVGNLPVNCLKYFK